MKKIPWGIFTGICAILIFYLTVSMIVAFCILGAIAGQTNTAATLFDTWWQTLIFVLDVVFVAAFVASLVMFIRGKLKGNVNGDRLEGGAN